MRPYYQDDSVTIYHGDCREVELPIGSVDLLLTDPPYGMGYVSAQSATASAVRSDGVRQGIRIVRQAMAALWPSLHPDAHVLVFCHWESYPDFYDALSGRCSLRNALVWHKDRGGMGDVTHEYARDYELVLYGALSRERPLNGKRPTAVLKGVPPVGGRERDHPTQKPVELMRVLIERHTPSVGCVLDPFLGAGSTVVAAKSLGRRAIGIELDERYCEIAARRCSQETLNLGGAA